MESRHVVFGCLWGAPDEGSPDGRVTEAWGEPDLFTFLRSALKPVQVLPLLVDGVADRLGLLEEEIALATGSHSGQDIHMAVLNGLMKKGGVTDDLLRCGRHRPYHAETARSIGEDYSVVHNNCSGKHAAMLAWCLAQDIDPAEYLSPDHPLQRRIIAYTSLLTGVAEPDMHIATDGCGVPTFAVPLSAMARMFRFLARPEALVDTDMRGVRAEDEATRLVDALKRTRKAMQTHPLMVAGEERPDTDTIGYTDGRLVTKAGAEGLWCGVDTRSGTSFAFKAVDGNFRAVVPAALEMLASRRLLGGPALQALERHHRPVVKNRAGAPVGTIVPHIP